MLIPSYVDIEYCFSNVICSTRANIFVNTVTEMLHLIFIRKGLYLACIPNNVKSDFAIGKSL